MWGGDRQYGHDRDSGQLRSGAGRASGSGSARPVRFEPLANTLLSVATNAALTLAATRRGEAALGTFGILKALISLDTLGGWETVQLRSTFIDHNAGGYTDPDVASAGVWQDVPLTATAALALRRAAEIADDYRLRPMPPGVVAIGLVWDSDSGAARALLEEADVSHADLIDVLQDELLDVVLTGLTASLDNGAADADTSPSTPSPARITSEKEAPGTQHPATPRLPSLPTPPHDGVPPQ